MSKPPTKAKMGRPTLYTEELVTLVCEELADGISLRQICERSDMPSLNTIIRWLRENEDFRSQYVRARELQADHHVDEIVYISDTEPDPQKARVRIDARKWVAGKQRPKVYGDKVINEVSGHDGGPLSVSFSVVPVPVGHYVKSDDDFI